MSKPKKPEQIEKLTLPRAFEYEGTTYGPGEVEFNVLDPIERTAHDVIGRTIATESEGGRTIAKADPEQEEAEEQPRGRGRRAKPAEESDTSGGA